MAAAVAAAAPAPGPTAEDLQLADAQQVAFAALDRHAWNGTLTADQYVPVVDGGRCFLVFVRVQGRFTVGAKGSLPLSARTAACWRGVAAATTAPFHHHVFYSSWE